MSAVSARVMVNSNLATSFMVEMENVDRLPSSTMSLNSFHWFITHVATTSSFSQSYAIDAASEADTATSLFLRYSMILVNSTSNLVEVSVSVSVSLTSTSISCSYSTLTLRDSCALDETLNLISSLISVASSSTLALHLNWTCSPSLSASTAQSRLDGAFFFFLESSSSLRTAWRNPRGPLLVLAVAASITSGLSSNPTRRSLAALLNMVFMVFAVGMFACVRVCG
mmetsp:Transcript_8598/g.24730  ORF Transcript_8598/g.24730 Transcript_8598/m.24730 type:complete len:226 (+) Transcript_8598:854-1531(+)